MTNLIFIDLSFLSQEQEIDFQKPKVYNKQKEKKRKLKQEAAPTASIVIPGIPGQQIVSLKRPKKEPHKYKTQSELLVWSYKSLFDLPSSVYVLKTFV